MRHAIAAVVLSQLLAAQTPGLIASVDPRVELLSTIFRLSGAGEYNQPQSNSAYGMEVDAYFGPYREHPVVKAAQELRKTRGVSFDAVMSMALHITDTTSLGEKIPFDQKPQRLDSRWPTEASRDFLSKARNFVKKTDFKAFMARHDKLFAAAAQRMTHQLAERNYVAWFNKYFGARRSARFAVIVGMLNGPANYGTGVVWPDGKEEITPIIGASRFDADGIPVFGDSIESTVVHEFCHTYTNPFVDEYQDELNAAGKIMFSHCKEVMKRQAYGTWSIMMKETLVRTCVVRNVLATDGILAAAAEINRQHTRGFKWVGECADLLAKYESHRDQYPTFDSFMPRLIAFFTKHAASYPADAKVIKKPAPRVVAMTPMNGKSDVDPDLRKIRVTFDQPMKNDSWSVVGGGEDFPGIAGKVSYTKDRMTFIIPVRLQPNWRYRFWLNRGSHVAFMSEAGVPLESVPVTFKTKSR